MAVAELRVICGPTAAGKSALALALAERKRATIISADSRQIYRGFDIGTAKPTDEERLRVPHEGIDVAEPTQRYSASAWADAAATWIDAARRAGRVPLVVGGTGFYLRALVEPLFEEPTLDPERRLTLQRELAAWSTADLRRWCMTLDPPRSPLGRAQLLRAIEVALLSGQRLSDLHAQARRPVRFVARYLVVDPGAVLAAYIVRRVDRMLATGWPAEVTRLVATVPEDAPAWNATGYGAIRQQARGELTLADARDRVVIETRQYAKRQRTWFRHQLGRDNVQRLAYGQSGWQEVVNSWMTEVVSKIQT